MIELSEPNGAVRMSTADSARRWDDANKRALHFMFGAQRMILEEMVLAAYATLDRVGTETHLLGEFASKLGAAHSVQDWKTMGSECGQHQLEFIRRDSDRIAQARRTIDQGDLKPVEQSAIEPSSNPEDSIEVPPDGRRARNGFDPIRPVCAAMTAAPTGATPSSRGRYASCRAR